MQVPPTDPARDASKDVHLHPPFVKIEGIINCRSVPVQLPDGTKPWLFRSGDISRITPQGMIQLQSYGIRTIFDLRSPSDVAKFESPAPVIEGVQIIKAQMIQDRTEDQEHNGSGGWYGDDSLRKTYIEFREDVTGAFMRSYIRMVVQGRESIAKVLRHLAERKEGDGVLFFCNAGKDRTGVLASLILSLAGVEDTQIIDDYALTTPGLEPHAQILFERFSHHRSFQEETEGAINLFSSRPETMRAFLTVLREKYGGVEQFVLNEAGLSKEEVEALKKMLN